MSSLPVTGCRRGRRGGHPIGIDVYLTVCGLTDSLARDFFFLKYQLANCSGDSLEQSYFGMMLDADIGSGTDDMTGLIRCLLDISGRKLIDLHPGANDVTALSAGVYFVRDLEAGAGAVRKVVVTR